MSKELGEVSFCHWHIWTNIPLANSLIFGPLRILLAKAVMSLAAGSSWIQPQFNTGWNNQAKPDKGFYSEWSKLMTSWWFRIQLFMKFVQLELFIGRRQSLYKLYWPRAETLGLREEFLWALRGNAKTHCIVALSECTVKEGFLLVNTLLDDPNNPEFRLQILRPSMAITPQVMLGCCNLRTCFLWLLGGMIASGIAQYGIRSCDISGRIEPAYHAP